jgi:cell fate (sporulation/competence/biofilm development) regulator YlbF (YheA/YmcA/DUF963 family)
MTLETVSLSPDLLAATEALAANVRQSEPLMLYYMAREVLESDVDAQELIRQLSETQVRIRTSQSQGAVIPADIEQLRALQGRAQTNRVITDYARTQQAAIASLREVNQTISELLGVDFAALAKQSGCC